MIMDTLNLEIQANSPYNDGWTQQFYKDEIKKMQTKTKEPKIHPKREEVAEANADALFADGFDDAIIGVTLEGNLIYDIDKAAQVISGGAGNVDDALEYVLFNCVGAHVGPRSPLWADIR